VCVCVLLCVGVWLGVGGFGCRGWGSAGFCVGVVGCWLGWCWLVVGWCLVVVVGDVPGGFAFWVGAGAFGLGFWGVVEAFVGVGSLVCWVGAFD